MPVINSYVLSSSGASVTSPSIAITMAFTEAASAYVTPTYGRSSAGFEEQKATGTGNTRTLSFSAMPSNTESSKRLVVFQIMALMNGSGAISSVSYGGTSFTRAISTSTSSDKGNSEIWYARMNSNPTSNTLTINGNNDILIVYACREVLLGIDTTAPYATAVNKKGSDRAVTVTLDHPTNGVTLLNCVLWKNGLDSPVSCSWSVGGATKSFGSTNSPSEDFACSSAYYVSATLDSNRDFGTNWPAASSPNQEVVGASWK